MFIAAVARQVYITKGLGVGTLRKYYGGVKRRGFRPNCRGLASGSVIRNALQSLEKIKVVEKTADGKGRQISQIGQQELDRIAGQVATAAEDN